MIPSWLGELPVPALIAIIVVVVCQLVLQVAALIDLAKRGSVLFDRKWIWLFVIVGGNLLGAIAYWSFARTDEPASERSSAAGSASANAERSERVVETLYGSEDE